MPKTYAELLKEAKASIREVTPQEAERLRAEGVTFVDVRETSEWDQGYIPGALHVARSYLELQIEATVPDRDAPLVLYCAGGVRSAFGAQTLKQLGYANAMSMSGGFQTWKARGPALDDPGRPVEGAAAALQPPSPDPGGRLGRAGPPPRVQGAPHRRGRPRQPGCPLPRRGRRGHDRDRRLRRRRRLQPPAPGDPRHRSGRPEEGRERPARRSRRSTPTSPSSATTRCSSATTSSGSSTATTSSSTGPTRSRRATSSTTRPSRPASRSSTPASSGSRAS